MNVNPLFAGVGDTVTGAASGPATSAETEGGRMTGGRGGERMKKE
jgi:hypothetical protein